MRIQGKLTCGIHLQIAQISPLPVRKRPAGRKQFFRGNSALLNKSAQGLAGDHDQASAQDAELPVPFLPPQKFKDGKHADGTDFLFPISHRTFVFSPDVVRQNQKAQPVLQGLIFQPGNLPDAVQLPSAVDEHLFNFVIDQKTHSLLFNQPGSLQPSDQLFPVTRRTGKAFHIVKEQPLQKLLQPGLRHFRQPLYREHLQPFFMERDSRRLTVNQQGGQVAGILQHAVEVALIVHESPMRGHGSLQRILRHEVFKHGGCFPAKQSDFLLLFPVRVVKPYVILMGTEAAFLYQLRNRDLRIDLPAHIDIALPLGRRGVIGRRGGQRDHHRALHLCHKSLQSFPPLIFQMMAFIQTDGADTRLLHLLHEREVPEIHLFPVSPVSVLLRLFFSVHRGKKRLVGQRGHQPRPVNIVGQAVRLR